MVGVNGYPRAGEESPGGAEVRLRDTMRPCFPEKSHGTLMHPVPKPTQVGGYKYTKARGRNLVKELGKIAP